MLGRLIKYDMKSISRLALPLTAIIFVTAVLGAVALKVTVIAPDNASGFPIAICITCVVAAFIAIFAYMVVVWILLLHRFYTNLFTDEGYLTFTLPVKPSTLITSKLITATVWTVISVMSAALCAGIILFFGSGKEIINSEWLSYISEFIGYLGANITAVHVIVAVINGLVSTIFSFLLIYLSITLAAVLTRKNKILVAIGVYYGINMIVSIFSTLAELIPTTLLMQGSDTAEYMLTSNILTIIIYSIFSVGAFILCNQLMKRKLNLD